MEVVRRYSTGLALVGLSILFVLTLLAPRSWQAQTIPPYEALVGGPASYGPIATRTIFVTQTDPAVPANVETAVEPEAGQPETPFDTPPLLDLSELGEQRQVAATAPPVAERIVLDPSIQESNLNLQPEPTLTPAAAAQERITASEPPLPVPVAEPDNGRKLVASHRVWPRPLALLDQLNALKEHPGAASWADETGRALERLHQSDSLAAAQLGPLLKELRVAVEHGRSLATRTPSLDHSAAILRACYGLAKRLDVWEQVHRLARGEQNYRQVDPTVTLTQLNLVQQHLAAQPHSGSWRQYLLLEDLFRMAAASGPIDEQQRRDLARRVLERMHAPTLAPEQAEHLQREPFTSLADQLRYWASEPVDYALLMREIENYEAQPNAESAQQIAIINRSLRWSPVPEVVELGKQLSSHYRNANLRVAISENFLNRLLPSPPTHQEPVRDQIFGANVAGVSRTQSQLQVDLLPDPSRLRLRLEVQGTVQTQTSSTRWPVTFFSSGASQYRAEKLVSIESSGIRLGETEADARSRTRLRGLQTDFDDLPLIRELVRVVAVQQHDSRLPDAQGMMRRKVADKARQRIDEEVEQRLAEAEERVDQRLFAPLRRLELDPTPVQMQTTDERLIVRYRFAGDRQLAAHTPRPQAPGDSLLSAQIHESALNNLVEQYGLADRQMDLHTLYRHIFSVFRSDEVQVPEEIPQDVTIRFAAREPVLVKCQNGHVLVTIRLAELSTRDGECWRNLFIHARYRPQVDGLQAELVRDGPIQLAGYRLSLRDQVALRGIFTKVLSRSRTAPLFPARLADHPQLAELGVTQLVIANGWIGIAIGPSRPEAVAHLRPQPTDEEVTR